MSDTDAPLVVVERLTGNRAGVAVIRLNRPPVNALSNALGAELGAATEVVATDDSIRAVVLYGSDRAFAAGADVKEFVAFDPADLVRHGLRLERAIDAVARIPKPVVAGVTGYALGGGCELALAADFRVCADNAQLGQPEILLGIIPGGGGTQRLPRLIGPARAKELIYSGRFVGSDEALAIGLVDRVVPAAEVREAAIATAAQYAAGPATALAAAKAAIDGGLDQSLDLGLLLERTLFAGLFATEDKAIGVGSFLEHGPGKAVFPTPGAGNSDPRV